LRYKGVLYIKGGARKVIIQGVHEMMGSDLGAPWGKDKKEPEWYLLEQTYLKMFYWGVLKHVWCNLLRLG